MPHIIQDVFVVSVLISLNIIIWSHCLFGEPSKCVEVAAVVLLSLLLVRFLVGRIRTQVGWGNGAFDVMVGCEWHFG